MIGLAGALVARAGGGHSFSGGGGRGGGGSFGGGGGGGHFFFFGGGGGAGGALGIVLLVVVVLVLLAVVAAVRRSRIGGEGLAAGAEGYRDGSAQPAPWTGSQEPAINSIRGEVFPGTHPDADVGAGSVAGGLEQIKAHDPEFNDELFLQQVQKAFFVVEEAWTERKPEMSRQVMTDGIWQQHQVQIEQYLAEHKRNVLEDLAVGDLQVISAHSDQSYDTITVRVYAACADYDVDDQSGKIVRGNKRVGQWQEDWTFQRSSAATTKSGGGTLSSKCPNCGAPLDVDLQGVCRYCHAPVMSGKYDWVLARIAQVM